jgi:hypothetical protein
MGHELFAATDDVQLLDTTNGPLTVTLLMLTAELLPLVRVKVNHAVPVPTGVLPKFSLDGLRVRVWAMSANGASNEAAIRVRIRLQTGLIGMLLCCLQLLRFPWRFGVRSEVSLEVRCEVGRSSAEGAMEARRTTAGAIRPRFWVSVGRDKPGRRPPRAAWERVLLIYSTYRDIS